MLTYKNPKTIPNHPKTKALKDHILSFQSTIASSSNTTAFNKMNPVNKKKKPIHKMRTIGTFEDKTSLTEYTQIQIPDDKEALIIKKIIPKENIKKLHFNMIYDEQRKKEDKDKEHKDISMGSLSMRNDDQMKECDEVLTLKRFNKRKQSLTKQLPELKDINEIHIRDLSVQERRTMNNNLIKNNNPLKGVMTPFKGDINNSSWNNCHYNKQKLVNKEKIVTLFKYKDNKDKVKGRNVSKDISRDLGVNKDLIIQEYSFEQFDMKNKEESNNDKSIRIERDINKTIAKLRDSKMAKGKKIKGNNIIKDKDECFSYDDEKPCDLTEDEKVIYGNREMKNYKKIRLLGKGGCGIVWECERNDINHQHYPNICAVKQVSKKTKEYNGQIMTSFNNFCQTAKNEIYILTTLNSNESNCKCPFIVDIFKTYEDSTDIWFSFELGGKSLSALCFKIKGEFYNNERIYSIQKGQFLIMLMNDSLFQFKYLIRGLLTAIGFISSKGFVHSDIKPENILVEYSGNSAETMLIESIKVIDFGSAYHVTSPKSLSSNTPEYMSPEVIDFLECNSHIKEKAKIINELVECPYAVDIWSLGITLLEIVLSCPIWMSYKAKIVINGKKIFKTGLFGFKGRDGTKIHQKQIEVSRTLHKLLQQSMINNLKERDSFEDLLSKMLCVNAKNRISPLDALNHPFLVI